MKAERFRPNAHRIRSNELARHAFIQSQAAQFSLPASASVRASVQQRLARELLMFHDRTGSDLLPLTQGRMSLMLGVRRASAMTRV
ncbi:hypothetical protein NOVOSPHI9U_210010 [Novosphingobium sp. 9U]|nr:hypothetical protein NOVOSPHI9U_210010 [Novosphingobium sp. 9U]